MAANLLPIPAIDRLSPRVIRILAGNPGKFTLQGTNTYLLGTGPRRILLDTGEGRPAWQASLKTTLASEGATISTALLSHWHFDHTSGVKDLLSIAPDVRVFKNPDDCGQTDHLQRRQPTSKSSDSCWEPISHGQVFTAEGVTLTAAHTPGHTTDHMVFILAEEDAMFTADNVLGQGTAVFEDLATYTASLETMRGLFSGRAYPGHGPVIEDGPGKIREYLEHRRVREAQVLRTMMGQEGEEDKKTWRTAMDIVRVVYADVREDLYPAAAGGVVQILEKLEGEGRVERDGERWRVRESANL